MFRKICGFLITLLTLGYMMPAGIACIRNAKSEPAIFLTNLLLGWTLIGWIVALAWALCGDAENESAVTIVRINGKTAYVKTSGRVRIEDVET
jgi:hypothetical protein